MSASLAKLIRSVTYTERNWFIQERRTAIDPSDCWLGNPASGRVRFKFLLWRLVSVSLSLSLSLCLCLVFSSLYWKDLNSFWKKTDQKNLKSFQWMILLIDSLIL